jgi:hypothetical protein
MGRFGPQWAKKSQIGLRHNIVDNLPTKANKCYPRSIDALAADDFARSPAVSQGIFSVPTKGEGLQKRRQLWVSSAKKSIQQDRDWKF